MGIRRGDIYYADLSPVVGSEQGGIRPVLIIQNDVGNRHSPTVICAAITSKMNKAKLPTHIEISTRDYQIVKNSVILLEQIRTIDKKRLREFVCHVDDRMMGRVSRANSRLRDVIAKAKSNNMPNDTIERNIKKAAGEGAGDNYEHITYEGYGPNGTAIIVKTLTDNKNRTASNVRSAFTKGSGNIGTPGCVSFMFDEKGQILVAKEDCEMDADELMMLALDAGAEDFAEEEESFEILTDPADFSEVRLKLEEAGIQMANAEVTMIPQTYVELTKEEDIKNIQKTLDLLEEDDDVQDVYHNWSEE